MRRRMAPVRRYDPLITVEHLTKRYGSFTAVDDLSFTIGEGHVYGFLGPNGAGKSTTMNMMTGCLSATEGHVKIDGFDIFEEPMEARRRIGYLPEQPPLYLGETPEEYLRFVGEAKGLRGGELEAQIDEVIEVTRLEPMRHRVIRALSKGYRQRVGIAQALLGNPEVVILDEPTVGLDPIQILEIRELIRSLGERHTVILSSHILSEVQAMCDRILIIAHGRLIAFDTPENLEKLLTTPGELILVADLPEERFRAILAEVPGVTDVACIADGSRLTGTVRAEGEDLYALSRAVFLAFAAAGEPLLEMRVKKADLEEIFLELTEADPISIEERRHEA